MTRSLVQLVYASRARSVVDQAELLAILEIARQNNSARGITGMLMHDRDCFFQVLEGPEQEVLSLYQRIAEDGRHKSIMRIMFRPIERREFPDWSMALAEPPEGVEGLPQGLSDFFRSGLPYTDLDAGQAHLLLNAFRMGIWRVEAA